VIGISGNDHAFVAPRTSRNAKRQIVGFTPRAGKHHAVELVWESIDQPLGIIDKLWLEIARVGAYSARLLRRGRVYFRVAMAETRHVIVEVEIGPPVGIVQPHTFAANEVHGPAVLEPIRSAQNFVTTSNQLGFAPGKV
jgi:hypothetical protein